MASFKKNLRLTEAAAAITDGAERGVLLAVEHWLTEANKEAPHDEGNLERSGSASSEGTRGAVSYDTPYAVRQHEDTSLRHPDKGRAKWLELSGAEEADTMGKIIQTAIKSKAGT